MIAAAYLKCLRKIRNLKIMRRWYLLLWAHTLKAITFFYGPQSSRGLWELD